MKRIILVDDDPDTLDALKLIFDPDEYNLVTYSNGNAILENQTEIPDLYILDKQISGVDGLDICRFLKSGQSTGHIPVIILSASPYIKNLAKAAGANDSLEKPFSIKVLREMVKLHLSL
ncbi:MULTISPECIES: response regulator [Niastella]|uniref:Response regulator n=1 Tax=Niastella soli TaxID=2821487 RepID=A0ABS3Z2F3_9BACT|nr:response regulator [Niastella soli]MBO9204346.1 response regulator [Niastella soli]